MGRSPWEAYARDASRAGLTWHVYQCADDYGDNGLEYFAAFADFDPDQGGTDAPGNPFYDTVSPTSPLIRPERRTPTTWRKQSAPTC